MQSTKSINRQIIAIAFPAIAANITTPILGLVDTAIAGHLGSEIYLGAIALGSTLFNLIYWLFGFLRMTTAGLTSQAYGAENRFAISQNLFRAVALALFIGIALIAVSPFTGAPLLRLLDADDALQPLAMRYFSILIFGAPAMLMTFALNGWLIGMQNTRLPMATAILTNIVNITASAVLVFGFALKIEGIALGTLISQWTAFIFCWVCAAKKYHPLRHEFKSYASMEGAGKLFRLNTDIFLRTLCMVAVTALFTRCGASQGVEILAANAILMQLFLFFSYFSDGFAYAGEALAGRYVGARDKNNFEIMMRELFKWGTGIALIFAAIYFFAGHAIIGLLTDREIIVDTAGQYILWIVAVPVCGIAAFIYDGIFVGLTATRSMLLSVFSGMATFIAVYLLTRAWGNNGLWTAFVLYLAVRGLILHLSLNKKREKLF